MEEPSNQFNVFVAEPVNIEELVFQCWCDGLSVSKTASKRIAVEFCKDISETNCLTDEDELLFSMMKNDTKDGFRSLEAIEQHIRIPTSCPLHLIGIDEHYFGIIVERYYEFNEHFIRSILGNKLTTKFRKDLDDYAKEDMPLRSCQRQFDNLRRIFNTMDDQHFEGPMWNILMNDFLLSKELAERYSKLVFLLYHRFQVQPSRKKTLSLTFDDLEYTAGLMMTHWTELRMSNSISARVGSGDWRMHHKESISSDSSDAEMETMGHLLAPQDSSPALMRQRSAPSAPLPSSRHSQSPVLSTLRTELYPHPAITAAPEKLAKFGNIERHSPVNIVVWLLSSLRRIKGVLFPDKAHAKLWLKVLKEKYNIKISDATFLCVAYGLLRIASGLNQTKEFRDLFEDVIVKVIEPLAQQRVSTEGAMSALEALRHINLSPVLNNITHNHKLQRYSRAWDVFLDVILPMIKRLFPRYCCA
eukprot:TRINITY_DN781959_c0_g1_i1.p1 TRINITY_DN781959_c0_g1~~TRINITY_DN781959_c0_g1_i1.p1  ORF type:complete len:473 (-),score=97.97 TRINITY_DN781959_c0_g1_i1:80-1498(-)